MVSSLCLLFCFMTVLRFANLIFCHRPDFEPSPIQLNRRFWLSSSAPLTQALNELTPEIIPDIQLILRHVERVEDAVLRLLPRRRITKPNDAIRLYSPGISKAWRNSLKHGFGNVGLIRPARNCGAEVRGVTLASGDQSGYTVDDLYGAIFNRGVAMKRRIQEITSRAIDNFTSPDVPFNFTLDTSSVRCTQSPACFGRQGEHYFTQVSVHNVGIHDFVVDGQETSILEYLRVVNRKLGGNPRLWLPVYDNGTVERVIRNDTTTFIQRWKSNPNPSCFRQIPMEQNPAVLEAMEKADFSAQQAEDALTSSNLAILVLPLGLNVIPLALFAEVDTKRMLMYMLMSDVLTVIPLAIKGAELMIIGGSRFKSVRTWISSREVGNRTKPFSIAGENFAAECRVREEVHKTGLILVLLSIVFLVIGIAGEIVARRYGGSRRRQTIRAIGDVSLPSEDLSSETSCGGGYKSSSKSRFDNFLGAGGEQQESYSEDEQIQK